MSHGHSLSLEGDAKLNTCFSAGLCFYHEHGAWPLAVYFVLLTWLAYFYYYLCFIRAYSFQCLTWLDKLLITMWNFFYQDGAVEIDVKTMLLTCIALVSVSFFTLSSVIWTMRIFFLSFMGKSSILQAACWWAPDVTSVQCGSLLIATLYTYLMAVRFYCQEPWYMITIDKWTRVQRPKHGPFAPKPKFPFMRKRRYVDRGCGFDHSVYGYPSSGGVLILDNPGPVEREFLQLSNPDWLEVLDIQNVDQKAEAEEEDQFCERLHRIGGKLWPDKRFHDEGVYKWWLPDGRYRWPGIGTEEEDYLNTEVVFAWTASGSVWVDVSPRVSQWVNPSKSEGRVPRMISMEERAKFMEEIGARFYEDPEDCPELKKMEWEYRNDAWVLKK